MQTAVHRFPVPTKLLSACLLILGCSGLGLGQTGVFPPPSGGGGAPTGSAGGQLSGSYPNPGFANPATFPGNVTIATTSPSQSLENNAAGVIVGNISNYTSGRTFLHSWQAANALLEQGGTTPAVLCVIGDSWTSQAGITNVEAQILQSRIADVNSAGPGYASFASVNSPPPSGVINPVSSTGTWTENDADTYALDAASVNSSDTSTPATKQSGTTVPVTQFVIHYLLQPGGGSFTWETDGGSATTISTANATTVYATLVIGNLTYTSHNIGLTVTVAGSAGVTLFGIDVQVLAHGGVRVHKLGHSGGTAALVAGVNATGWETGITALGCSTAIIRFGTNEQVAQTTPAAMVASLQTIVGNLMAAIPLVDVVIATPSDNALGGTYTMANYSAAMADLARNNYGFINAYKYLGPYATSNSLGLMANTSHPNSNGYQQLAWLDSEYLLSNIKGNISPASYNLATGSVWAGTSGFGLASVGIGVNSLHTATGSGNTATGWNAMSGATTAANNTAAGYNALSGVTTGTLSACVGEGACPSLTTNGFDAAVGALALNHDTGGFNSAVGEDGLFSVTSGTQNTCVGYLCGSTVTTGTHNSFLGDHTAAAAAATYATAVGAGVTVPCSNCIILGRSQESVSIGGGTPVGSLDVPGPINFAGAPTPAAITAGTPTSGGSCTAGTHTWEVTFITAAGESLPSAASSVQTCGANATVPLSVIPLGPVGTTGRNVYATKTGNSGSYFLVATAPVIANNTAATYSFTIADGSFTGTTAPVSNSTATMALQVGGSTVLGMTAVAGSTNHTVCWKTTTTLSYCTSIVGADGTCTCN